MNMIFPIVHLIVSKSKSNELNSFERIDIDGVWVWREVAAYDHIASNPSIFRLKIYSALVHSEQFCQIAHHMPYKEREKRRRTAKMAESSSENVDR